MRPTFYGLEIGKKALNAGQLGLDITGQNMANIHTEGYARQRLEQSSDATATAGVYIYADPVKAKISEGVNVTGVTQIRNQFLDMRYYKGNAEFNKYDTALTGLTDLEYIIDEGTTDGLGTRLADFIAKLHDMSGDSAGIETANILRTSAQKLTQVLNQSAEQLEEVKNQQMSELGINIADVNTILDKINNANIQIRNEKLQGNTPNELLDLRNKYLDDLSAYTGITIEPKTDGSLSVLSGGTYLIDATTNTVNKLSISTASGSVDILNSDGTELPIKDGILKGHLFMLNGAGTVGGDDESLFRGIKYYENSLNSFAKSFADTLNTLNGVNGTTKPLFSGDALGNITAGTIKISDQWVADCGYISTTSSITGAGTNKNDNILLMLKAMENDTAITPSYTGSYEEFITSLNGELGVDVDYHKDMTDSNKSIKASLEKQRESVMGVNLDEEGANLIKYNKAYSAAARFMTALDEALDVIINKLGTVGR